LILDPSGLPGAGCKYRVQRDSEKQAVEVFETQSAMVTAAIMAPVPTKQLILASTYDVLAIIRERSSDLATGVLVTAEFGLQ
jgi:hypothetical protein